jgi:NTE family protein
VAALAAAGLTTAQIRERILAQRRKDFWDPDPLGIAADLWRSGSRTSGLLKGARFRGLLEQFVPARTFAELSSPLLLVAANVSNQSAEVMTEGDLASAIHATCAYPGLFQVVRRGGALLWDGGIVDKAPALALADSALGSELETLLVHFLPSRDEAGDPAGAFAWPSGMAAGIAALRKDHFRLQLEVLRARGVAVHVVTSKLPPVGPTTMERGVDALEAAKRSLEAALAAPPQSWLGSD